MENGKTTIHAKMGKSTEMDTTPDISKEDDNGTPFSWINGEIDKNCSWTEFQKATRGSNKNKAEAYYKHTGRTKDFKARTEYMGATPQKESPTGREVIKRLYEARKLEFPKDDKKYKKYISGNLYEKKALPKGFLDKVKYNKVALSEYDMGHKSPDDAVIKWNNFFSKLGEEDGKKLARKWMQDPDIYELQLKGKNRSEGAKLGHIEDGRYRAPETDPDKINTFRKNSEEEIKKINATYAKNHNKKG